MGRRKNYPFNERNQKYGANIVSSLIAWSIAALFAVPTATESCPDKDSSIHFNLPENKTAAIIQIITCLAISPLVFVFMTCIDNTIFSIFIPAIIILWSILLTDAIKVLVSNRGSKNNNNAECKQATKYKNEDSENNEKIINTVCKDVDSSSIYENIKCVENDIKDDFLSKKIGLYDIIPTRNIELKHLFLGQRIYKETYIKKETLLYSIEYMDPSGRMFNINLIAPYDCYYVPNNNCKEHARQYDYGYTDTEPILCEFWKSEEDYEISKTPLKQWDTTVSKHKPDTKKIKNFEYKQNIISIKKDIKETDGPPKRIGLYDVIPTRNIELKHLILGHSTFKETYVEKGTLLYEIEYKDPCGRMFSIRFLAPYDCFYVPNIDCIQHAKLYDYGYAETEPILCEFWKSKEDFENSEISFKQLVFTQPKYYSPIANTQTITTYNETCYTYLMKDEKTGYYKIGMSKDPKYRERTLQSEKPTIVLLACRKHYSREEARNRERNLHQKYRHARVRGEWFNLSPNDVIDIKLNL